MCERWSLASLSAYHTCLHRFESTVEASLSIKGLIATPYIGIAATSPWVEPSSDKIISYLLSGPGMMSLAGFW